MGWNGSGGARSPQTPKVTATKPSPVRGIVAGLVVVAIAAAAAYFLLFSGDQAKKPVREDTKKGLIKEVTPAAAPKAKVPTNAERLRARFSELTIPDDWDKPYPPQAYWPDGRLKQHSRYVKVVTNERSRASMSIEEFTFKNHAEQQIAGLLRITPGSMIVGDRKYGAVFVKHFLRSLNEPIVIDEEHDTEAQKELKRMVMETKKELKAAYDRGEDIAAMMNETRTQLKELGLYRQEIKKMVADVRKKNKDKFNEADEADLINAANAMLKERGCEPLRAPRIFLEAAEHLK